MVSTHVSFPVETEFGETKMSWYLLQGRGKPQSWVVAFLFQIVLCFYELSTAAGGLCSYYYCIGYYDYFSLRH